MPDVLTGQSDELSQILTDPSNTIVLHLAKNPTATLDLVGSLADLRECDFPGYAPVQIVNPDVFEGDDVNVGEAVSDALTFQASSALAVPQVAYAAYLTWQNGAGPINLKDLYELKGGFTFDVPGRIFRVRIRFSSFADNVTPPDLGAPGDE